MAFFASLATSLMAAPAASGFCAWGSEHCRRPAFLAPCDCDAGWEGACCTTLSTCDGVHEELCPRSKLEDRSVACADVGAGGPFLPGTATAGLPKVLHGVFWLMDQGQSSSLVSFGPSNDGSGMSVLSIPATSDGYHFKLRVGGDRIWSFGDKGSEWDFLHLTELIYKFRMEDAAGAAPATADEIVAAQIVPTFLPLFFGGFAYPESILSFRMKLLPAHERYNTSVMWARPSELFQQQVSYYEMLQVLDGEGNRLEPAFSDWLSYCHAPATGSSPGRIWYREAV